MTVNRDALLSVVADLLGRMYGARSDIEKQDRLVDAEVVIAEVEPFIERLEQQVAALQRLVRELHDCLGISAQEAIPHNLRPVLAAALAEGDTE